MSETRVESTKKTKPMLSGFLIGSSVSDNVYSNKTGSKLLHMIKSKVIDQNEIQILVAKTTRKNLTQAGESLCVASIQG